MVWRMVPAAVPRAVVVTPVVAAVLTPLAMVAIRRGLLLVAKKIERTHKPISKGVYHVRKKD